MQNCMRPEQRPSCFVLQLMQPCLFVNLLQGGANAKPSDAKVPEVLGKGFNVSLFE